jgi:hypothetical protein
MDVREMCDEEARQVLIDRIHGMDVDDLALAVSETHRHEDDVIVVRGGRVGNEQVSYAYWNGYSSDERGNADCFTEEGLTADELREQLEGHN